MLRRSTNLLFATKVSVPNSTFLTSQQNFSLLGSSDPSSFCFPGSEWVVTQTRTVCLTQCLVKTDTCRCVLRVVAVYRQFTLQKNQTERTLFSSEAWLQDECGDTFVWDFLVFSTTTGHSSVLNWTTRVSSCVVPCSQLCLVTTD